MKHKKMITPYFADRHEPLTRTDWSEDISLKTIHSILDETIGAFSRTTFWPVHPEDKEWDRGAPFVSLFWGASSTVWALDFFSNVGVVQSGPLSLLDISKDIFRSYLEKPDTRDGYAPGYLMGELGILVQCYKQAPTPDLLDKIEVALHATIHREENELMWGAPGALLVADWLYRKTAEPRWLKVVSQAADKLFVTWTFSPNHSVWLWTQRLYGDSNTYLGAVHGMAGNLHALLRVKEHLSVEQRNLILSRAEETYDNQAHFNQSRCNWKPRPESPDEKFLVQWCHGAPGVITSLDSIPFGQSQTIDRLLEAGGQLIWKSGPLKKPFGLCHGSAGNGLALLKLFKRTGNKVWLERARAFAMHAIDQSEQQLKVHGCRRYNLLLGDLGLAYFLWCCIHQEADWPLVDRI